MYDYRKEMKEDILIWFNENMNDKELPERRELEEFLYDELWAEDDVTGNGSCGYGTNEGVKECVLDNAEICKEALVEFCTPAGVIAEHFLDGDWKYFDCTIRCYLLGETISAALDTLYEEDK